MTSEAVGIRWDYDQYADPPSWTAECAGTSCVITSHLGEFTGVIGDTEFRASRLRDCMSLCEAYLTRTA